MRVDVEPGMRIAADVTWEAAAKYHCLSWRYHCSIEGVAEALAAAVATADAGVAAARRRGGPQEPIRPSRQWSRIV